jgi:hypothetical protein
MFAYTKLMQAMAAAGVVSNNDPYFNLTTLLLNTTATNGAQNNTFLDSGPNNFALTRNGTPTQGTFTPFSQTGWSAFNVGSASFCQLNNSDYSISTGDFTIEFWMFVTSDKAATCFASAASNPDLTVAMNGGSAGARFPYLEYATGGTTFATAFSNYLNTWTHVAFVRSSGTVTVYQNGVAITSASKAGAVGTTANLKLLRNSGDTGQDFPGYISNFRICKAAVYTGNFTPTTTNFTTTSQGATSCQLLTFQNNRFIDNSSNAATVTPTLTSIQAFSPFLPTAAYDTAVVGGSGLFNGTTDYLLAASNTAFSWGTGDFSMESWVYPQAGGLIRMFDSDSAQGFLTFLNSGNTFGFYGGDGNFYESANETMKQNAWNHCVVTGVSGALRLFVNGVLVKYNATGGSSTASARTCGIGSAGSQWWNGYMSNVRLVKGGIPTAYSTASTTLNAVIFTPPTAPFTGSESLTGGAVSLLANFTNANIFDSTAKKNLETVGTAQVSTTQAKWGTTSMYFAGSGNYLLTPYSPNLVFGTADFTFECQLYWTGGNSENTLIMNNASGGFAIKLQATTATNWALENAYVGQVADFGTAPTKNVWHHIAVTRASGTLYAFIDGTQVFSGANSTNFTNTASWYIAGNGASTSLYITGYIDDLRITTGYARYTASFTPPTAAFPLQ